MPKCKGCGEKCERRGPIALCGSDECFRKVAQAAYEKQRKAKERQAERARKKQRQKDASRKKELRSRSDWYKLIQREVNAYVRHRDRDQPCCTCGTTAGIKYDAGHYRTVAAAPEIRFEPTNIHKQCSVRCNQYGSGMRLEYRDFLLAKYGADHLAWLDGKHPGLTEQFPTWQDLEAELSRWRKINRDASKYVDIRRDVGD